MAIIKIFSKWPQLKCSTNHWLPEQTRAASNLQIHKVEAIQQPLISFKNPYWCLSKLIKKSFSYIVIQNSRFITGTHCRKQLAATSTDPQCIYQDSRLLALVVYFAKLVYGQSNMHSTFNFCPKADKTEMNIPLHKRS